MQAAVICTKFVIVPPLSVSMGICGCGLEEGFFFFFLRVLGACFIVTAWNERVRVGLLRCDSEGGSDAAPQDWTKARRNQRNGTGFELTNKCTWKGHRHGIKQSSAATSLLLTCWAAETNCDVHFMLFFRSACSAIVDKPPSNYISTDKQLLLFELFKLPVSPHCLSCI